jgi:paraquat-inducible protein A
MSRADDRASTSTAWVDACAECDLLQRVGPVPVGGKALCARCGFVLATRPRDPIGVPLALTVTAAIVFVIGITTPLMGMSVVGRQSSTTIIGGALAMWQQGEPITGALVMFCAVIAPACFILFMLTMLLLARWPPLPRWSGEVLRWGMHMHPWSMFEVMLLGILVALIKIAELASVEPGIGIFAVGALTLLFPAIIVNFDVDEIWRRVEWLDDATDRGTGEAQR